MASPLTLMLPIIPGTDPGTIAKVLGDQTGPLHAALTQIGTVHYARFLLLDRNAANLQPGARLNPSDPFVLAVITEYDGSFNQYIQDFVTVVGPIFDALLQFVQGAQGLIPVRNHVAAFQQFIIDNDASQQPPNGSPGHPTMYEAYTATVQAILASVPTGDGAPTTSGATGSASGAPAPASGATGSASGASASTHAAHSGAHGQHHGHGTSGSTSGGAAPASGS